MCTVPSIIEALQMIADCADGRGWSRRFAHPEGPLKATRGPAQMRVLRQEPQHAAARLREE
eukprot:12684414-Alexandrium_andersonii.AAC.1